MIYVLIAICIAQGLVIAVLFMAVTASSEIITDLRSALKRARGEQ